MGQRDEARRVWREGAQRATPPTTCCAKRWRACRSTCEPARGRAALGSLALAAAGRLRRRCQPPATPAGERCPGRLVGARRRHSTARRRAVDERRLRAARRRQRRRLQPDHAARHHAGAGALGARAACVLVTPQGETPLRRPRRADRARCSARACRWRRCSTGCAAGPGPARRSERRCAAGEPGFEQLGWRVDLARFDDGAGRGPARRAARR